MYSEQNKKELGDVTLETILEDGKKYLHEKEVPNADLDAWLLMEHFFQIKRIDYFMNPKRTLTEKEQQDYLTLIELRGTRVPLQHITGVQEFMGLPFDVSRDVLIPRQDTEVLVEEVLKVCEGKSLLDMCTGSGCIAISADKLGKLISATGVDLSEKALVIAEKNNSKLEASVTFLQSDLFDKVEESYDIIVSNPPYISTEEVLTLMPEVLDHEPMSALDGREDGLYFYRRIVRDAKTYFNQNGYLFLEIGCDQGMDLKLMLEQNGYVDIRIIKDLAGLDRVVAARYNR